MAQIDINQIKRKIARAEAKLNDRANIPKPTQTYHGGWIDGYWQGRISALEDFLDYLEQESE